MTIIYFVAVPILSVVHIITVCVLSGTGTRYGDIFETNYWPWVITFPLVGLMNLIYFKIIIMTLIDDLGGDKTGIDGKTKWEIRIDDIAHEF